MPHSSAFIKLVDEARKNIQEMSVAEAAEFIQTNPQVPVIDVRETEEYDNGHLPNALHLSKGLIELQIEQVAPDTDAEILLYCGGGFRSALAADNLRKMGYTKVISMDGGFRGWMQAGLPIVI
jgi:rhodanese-related sulfurtransferase